MRPNNLLINATRVWLPMVLAGVTAMVAYAGDGTRGIGKYPGLPSENFSPSLRVDDTYRNIALHRMARHSSSYDYNLTAQLTTDGIVATAPLPYLTARTNSGTLPRREREWAIDGGEYTRNILMGDNAFIEYVWNGMTVRADRLRIICSLAYDAAQTSGGYAIRILQKDKKGRWTVIGEEKGAGLPGKESKYKAHTDPNKVTEAATLPTRNIDTKIAIKPLGKAGDLGSLRVEFAMNGAVHWTVTELKFSDNGNAVTDVLPSRSFGSAWMSEGGGTQWVSVDLGTTATFDRVRLDWMEKAVDGRIEVSDDGKQWKTVAALPGGKSLTDNVSFALQTGRYVRVLMTRPGRSGRYVLSEFGVMGRGGLTAEPHALAGKIGGRYLLDGGGWKLQRASEVEAVGEQISSDGFVPAGWIPATVPGTVLMSYVNIGALADPNIADNMLQISESFFNSDFWYRTEFKVPQEMKGRHVFLNFDGINWKADIYLNGHKIDRMEGAFMRGRTDVTSLLKDGDNVLAVKIEKNAHPGAVKEKYKVNTDFNGGILGYDNPTFHATIGWDWISTIRGRDIGIWNDVALTASGAVSLSDPLLTSRLNLPDTTATMTPSVVLANNEEHTVSGTLRGWIGDRQFDQKVSLMPRETKEISFNPSSYSVLKDQTMRLWWPNGYGQPYLYDAGFEFVTDDETSLPSDRIDYKAGVRQVDYRDMDTRLTMYINGRRFVPLGGNWGFSENNLCYRGREYDIAVKYHRDMNFNTIRNWVGQTGDEEFYQACDKYGIVVWQDFWLANPADGPDPLDEKMFLENAADYVARIRNHPSIGIYCGRNEGYPPKTIDTELRSFVKDMHQGLGYISSSADDGVSGHGPYWALPAKEYFARQTGKLHSERGMPNVMTYEGLSRTLSPDALWPQGDQWGQHDYCQQGAQRGATFNAIVEKAFGNVTNARQFTSLAQWENYDGYRAMYESGSSDRMGLLIWMSHAAWPSMTWQCYDYYFEPTAAFFGCKKACEPIHIQWNALTRNVEVVNRAAGTIKAMKATREVFSYSGQVVDKSEQTFSSDDDTTVVLEKLRTDSLYELNGQNVYYIRLRLADNEGKTLSDNFYVCSNDEGNLKELNNLPEVNLVATVRNGTHDMTVKLTNESQSPAMMVRLNLMGSDGIQILPVNYSDNYFHLMPGDSKTVTVEWKEEDARSAAPQVEISGFNVKERTLR